MASGENSNLLASYTAESHVGAQVSDVLLTCQYFIFMVLQRLRHSTISWVPFYTGIVVIVVVLVHTLSRIRVRPGIGAGRIDWVFSFCAHRHC